MDYSWITAMAAGSRNDIMRTTLSPRPQPGKKRRRRAGASTLGGWGRKLATGARERKRVTEKNGDDGIMGGKHTPKNGEGCLPEHFPEAPTCTRELYSGVPPCIHNRRCFQ